MFSKAALILMGVLSVAMLALGVAEELRIHNLKMDLKDGQDKIILLTADNNTLRADKSILTSQIKSNNRTNKNNSDQSKKDAALAAANARAALAVEAERNKIPVGAGPDAMNQWMQREFAR